MRWRWWVQTLGGGLVVLGMGLFGAVGGERASGPSEKMPSSSQPGERLAGTKASEQGVLREKGGGLEKPTAQKASGAKTGSDKSAGEKASLDKSAEEKAVLDALWQKIYTRPAELARLSRPTVCILDIQHPDKIYNQLKTLSKPMEQFYACRFRDRVAEISGWPTIVVHAMELSGEDLERPQIRAIVIGGRSQSLPREVDQRFYRLLRETNIPILGICGGCQLIGQAYGAKVVRMRKLRPGEKDPNPSYHPGWFKEWGAMPVQVVQSDPLFANLPERAIFREFHAFQIAEPPKEFDLLASTEECRVQAMKHRDRLVYAVQFHPERYDQKYPHGRVVLENFFRLVVAYWSGRQGGERKQASGLPKREKPIILEKIE